MPELIGLREFARREGCSPTLVVRGIKSGRLPATPKKKIDAALVGTEWRDGNVKRAANGAAAVHNAVHSAATEPAPTILSVVPELAESLRKKEFFLASQRELEYRQKEGELIGVAEAESAFFECARGARDAWLSWPSRVAPYLAAELNVDAGLVAELLTRHVHTHIAELGEPELELAPGQGG